MNIPIPYIEQITVEALKIKLTSHCGTTANSMELQLKDESGRVLATLDDGRMLGYYSPQDGCIPLMRPSPRHLLTCEQKPRHLPVMHTAPANRLTHPRLPCSRSFGSLTDQSSLGLCISSLVFIHQDICAVVRCSSRGYAGAMKECAWTVWPST